jgi:hypothetical protein
MRHRILELNTSKKEASVMGNTKENETVAGSGNSVAAVEGGYGPGQEGTGDGPQAPLTPERGSDSPGRQESQATIRSRDPNTDEGVSQKDLNEALGRDED